MKKEDIQALFQNFEDAVCTIDDTECWSARDMQKLLGYSLWQNFTNVINKAKAACQNVGQPISDHFIDVNKKVDLGSGAQREVDDEWLRMEKAARLGWLSGEKARLTRLANQFSQYIYAKGGLMSDSERAYARKLLDMINSVDAEGSKVMDDLRNDAFKDMIKSIMKQ